MNVLRRAAATLLIPIGMAACETDTERRQIEVAFNANVETVMVLFSLSSEQTKQLFSSQIPPLLQESIVHFESFKDHEAVRLMDEVLEHTWLDGIVGIAVNATSVPHADLSVSSAEKLMASFAGGGETGSGAAELQRFVAALNRFYLDADVGSFISAHQAFYDGALMEVESSLPPEGFVEAMEAFYGEEKAAFRLVPSLLLYRGIGFGSRAETPAGMEVFNTFGPLLAADPSEAEFGFDDPEGILELSTHEFGHSFVNPLVDSPALAEAVADLKRLHEPIRERMASLGYRSWEVALKEHLVRLGEIRIAEAMGDPQAAARLRTYHVEDRGFAYLPALERAVLMYEENRERYPAFGGFLPVLLSTMAEM